MRQYDRSGRRNIFDDVRGLFDDAIDRLWDIERDLVGTARTAVGYRDDKASARTYERTREGGLREVEDLLGEVRRKLARYGQGGRDQYSRASRESEVSADLEGRRDSEENTRLLEAIESLTQEIRGLKDQQAAGPGE
ncbi:hypothetical protein BTM25_44810 [Actinomadura rubteroloni]|uniref:Uncharacterized protein n=1 Tax=Actinomadura rubteroloni TaxID=1926885 RepID=A0A2P4UE84_9ACTN|nr:hypothetical protein [Actinomadura rubteroloni]POM23328.1 hypothetical protein BTM25_44810 [Actinomadura rubteroloni]